MMNRPWSPYRSAHNILQQHHAHQDCTCLPEQLEAASYSDLFPEPFQLSA